MKGGGFIKLWRQILDSAVFADAGTFQLFIALLLKAYHRPAKAVLKIGRQAIVVELRAGQCVVRERLLARDLGIGRNTLRRRLAVLVEIDCITLETTPRYSVVTIRNWHRYQCAPEAGATVKPVSEPITPDAGATVGPVSEPVSEPHQKKERRKEVCGPRTTFQKPTVEAVQQYAAQLGYQLDASRFVDYYESVGWKVGKGKPMRDWQAAVRNWRRGDVDRNGKPKSEYKDLTP